jgi:uncharacterized lipoprotein YbaY
MKMKSLILAALGLAFLAAGCGHMDLTPEGDPNRILTGTVETRDPMLLPRDAVAMVRVLDSSRADMPPQVLGDVEIRNPGATPIPFRIEYRADDALLLRGLNVEARISYDGKVRYSTLNQVGLTMRNAMDPHRVTVNALTP